MSWGSIASPALIPMISRDPSGAFGLDRLVRTVGQGLKKRPWNKNFDKKA